MSGKDKRINHPRALGSAVVIVIYFSLITVWLPSALLRSPLLAGADRNIGDLVALVVWGAGLALGLWRLRRAQDRDVI